MADDCGDIPPLEDMSELIKQADILREKMTPKPRTSDSKDQEINLPQKEPERSKEGQSVPPHSKLKTKEPILSSNCEGARENVRGTNPKSTTTGGFGGLKKGFLFGGGSSSKRTLHSPQSRPTQKDDIPFIRPKSSKEKDYQLPEVQEAIDASKLFATNKEWITEGLLQKIAKNPGLAAKLSNPNFVAAVTEFQTNPTEAMNKYANNSEMQTFLKEFCGIMGDHFSTRSQPSQNQESGRLGPTEPPVMTSDPENGADIRVRSSTNPHQMTAADEEKMQDILASTEIRDILMDPKIQQLISTLRECPDQAQSTVARADPSLQKKIRKLIEVGLLQFQR